MQLGPGYAVIIQIVFECILTKGKIAKKISKAKLDKKPSIAPLTKGARSRTEKIRKRSYETINVKLTT